MNPSSAIGSRSIILALVVLCLSCVRHESVEALSNDAPVAARCRVVKQIPLETFGNLYFLRVHVNDNPEPVKMALDSASHDTYLFTDKADKLSLKREGAATRPGEGGNAVPITFAKNVTLDISGVKLADLSLAVTPNRIGPHADGILGYDLFSRFVVKIDYEGLNIKLYEPQCEIKSSAASILPLTFAADDPRIPTIRARLQMPERDFVEGTFDVDTGAGASAIIRPAFVERHRLLETKQRLLSISSRGGLSGVSVTSKIGRAKAFQLGGFTLSGPIITFFVNRANDREGKDGLIGNGLLQRFKVTFDYRRKRMILEPNARLTQPFESDMSGLRLAEDRKNFKITNVLEDSPGSRSGFMEGDVIVAIDGKPAGTLDINEARQMFKQDGRTYLLSVKRGEELKQISLTVKRIL